MHIELPIGGAEFEGKSRALPAGRSTPRQLGGRSPSLLGAALDTCRRGSEGDEACGVQAPQKSAPYLEWTTHEGARGLALYEGASPGLLALVELVEEFELPHGCAAVLLARAPERLPRGERKALAVSVERFAAARAAAFDADEGAELVAACCGAVEWAGDGFRGTAVVDVAADDDCGDAAEAAGDLSLPPACLALALVREHLSDSEREALSRHAASILGL
eukprot:tig00000640_g2773.t1